jgi:hypothetical protein
MTEVILSNDDLTVLGPPDTVEVLVDIGPTGTRGSQVFVGIGDPNIVEIGQTPILNDLYINTSPGEDYSYLYQYVSEPGGDLWVEILKMNPTIYSKNFLTSFSNGQAQIIIPISSIVNVSGTPLTIENFSIQYSIRNDSPVSSSMILPALTGAGENLVINLKAAEYTLESGPSADWQALEGTVGVDIFITIVAENEES